MSKKCILVCGARSVGKTSLFNLLMNNNYNDNVKPIIKENYKLIELRSLEVDDNGYFLETPAEYMLKNQLKEYEFDLLVHVIKRSALTEVDIVNYEVVYKDFFFKTIRILCVINFSEEADPFENDWDNKKENLFKRGFFYDDGVSVCCGHVQNKTYDRVLEEYRKISYKMLWDKIEMLTKHNTKAKIVQSYFSNFKPLKQIIQLFSASANNSFNNKIVENKMNSNNHDFRNHSKYRLLLIGPNLCLNRSFKNTFYNQASLTNRVKNIFYEYEFVNNGITYILTNICYENISDSILFDKFYDYFKLINEFNGLVYVDQCDNLFMNKNVNFLKILKDFFNLKIDFLIISCNEEQMEDGNVQSRIMRLFANENLSFNEMCKMFFKTEIKNEAINNIYDGYKKNNANQVNPILTIIKDYKKSFIVDKKKVDGKIRFNLPIKIPFDIDLDLYECALLSSCSKSETTSMKIIIDKGFIPLP